MPRDCAAEPPRAGAIPPGAPATAERRLNKLLAIQCFVATVDQDGFAGAARQLRLSNATVTKLVNRLEAELGARLLHRNSRAQSVTDTGRRYYDRCVAVLAQLQQADGQLAQETGAPAGRIRIAMQVAYARGILPFIGRFLALHPGIEIDLIARDDAVDLIGEGFDLWVTTTARASRSAGLRMRTMVRSELGVFAAPDYLARHGTPEEPDDLRFHNCIASPSFGLRWPLRAADGRVRQMNVGGNLTVTSGEILREAVVAGLGLTFSNTRLFDRDLKEGRVVRILNGHTGGTGEISIVFPATTFLPRRIRLLIDFLSDIEKRALTALPGNGGLVALTTPGPQAAAKVARLAAGGPRP